MDTVIIFAASYLYLVVLALGVGAFLLSDTPIKWNIAKLAVVVFPLCFIVAQLLGMVISSPRPFIVDHVTPLIHAATDNGFPSDHTLLAMAIAAIIFAYHRKLGSMLIILAVGVGVGRVLAWVHHPIDVIGSIMIVLTITVFAYRLVMSRFFSRWPQLSQETSTSL